MPAKILVVDDEPDMEILIRQRFRKHIRDDVFSFAFATNGVEALRQLETADDIDVVLADINMPEMDGLTLLGKINEGYPWLKVVMVSAYGDMENIRTAMNRGALDFLTKPIDFNDLEITIVKSLEEASAYKVAKDEHDQLVKLQRELDIAKNIQLSMLPTETISPERHACNIHTHIDLAREVGGDFYDYFLLDKERLGFVIGDVSGKGIPAALFMMRTRTILRSIAIQDVSPGVCIQHVNRLLSLENVPNMFVTLFYGILQLRSGALEYCNGGHNHPYVVTDDGQFATLSEPGGPIVGAFTHMEYATHMTKLEPKSTLFMYTDGITEARNHEEEEFSEDRLESYLADCNVESLTEFTQGMLKEVAAFVDNGPQTDDMTIMSVQYLG
jgi:phosphoserine phosphatase RsbU/P